MPSTAMHDFFLEMINFGVALTQTISPWWSNNCRSCFPSRSWDLQLPLVPIQEKFCVKYD